MTYSCCKTMGVLGELLSCQSPAASLVQAIEDDDTAVTGALLEEKPSLIYWKKFGEGLTALQIAAGRGRCGAVEAILQVACATASKASSARKANAVLTALLNHKNVNGQTALMMACRHRHPEVVRLLLDMGADPLLFDSLHSKTCLHYAVLGGSTECVEALLGDHTLIKRRDKGGFQRLRDACVMDSQGYHRFVDVRTVYAFAPLHVAASLDMVEVARVLVKYGANLGVRCTGVMSFSALGYQPPWKPFATPLHISVANRNYRMVQMLLGEWASGEAVSSHDLRMLPDFTGSRPVDIAMRTNQPYLAYILDPSIPLRTVWLRLNPVGSSAGDSMGAHPLKALAAKQLRQQLYEKLLVIQQPPAAMQPCKAAVTVAGGSKVGGVSSPGPQAASVSRVSSGLEPAVYPLSAGGSHTARRRGLPFISLRSSSLDSRRQDQLIRPSFGARRVMGTRADSSISGRSSLHPDQRQGGGAGNHTDHGGALYAELVMACAMEDTPAAVVSPKVSSGGQFMHLHRGSVIDPDAACPAGETDECAICCDALVEVKAVQCGHQLCRQCALHLVDPDWDTAPSCPFCRAIIHGFEQ